MLLSALHNVGPEALEEAEHLVCLLIRDSEVAQCACSMAHECLPIGGSIDSHPVMGQFHAATGVEGRTTSCFDHEVDDKLSSTALIVIACAFQ